MNRELEQLKRISIFKVLLAQLALILVYLVPFGGLCMHLLHWAR